MPKNRIFLIVGVVFIGVFVIASLFYPRKIIRNAYRTDLSSFSNRQDEIILKEGIESEGSGSEEMGVPEKNEAQESTLKTAPQGVTQAGTTERVRDLIERLRDSDAKTAQEAADALVKIGEEAVPELLDAAKDGSVSLKGQIGFLLGRIGDKQATSVLIEMLTDDNAYVRANAAEALGKIKDNSALIDLARGLFDDDAIVRERVAWSLGELRDSRGAGDLINRLADEREEQVKSAVVGALGKLRDQRATSTLVRELKAPNDQLYKNEVVFSLGELRDKSALEDVKTYLDELKSYAPQEAMLKNKQEEAIRFAEEAIAKIER